MAARTAKLHLTPGFLGSSVEVDGRKVTGIRALNIRTAVDELPTMTLDLILREVEIDGELIITMSDETRDALVALGWTPPADKPTSGAGQKSKIALNIQPKEPESRVIVVGDPRMRA